MGCWPWSKKHICPLCHDSRRKKKDFCDQCMFVRQYAVEHGRDGLRFALRGHPYEGAVATTASTLHRDVNSTSSINPTRNGIFGSRTTSYCVSTSGAGTSGAANNTAAARLYSSPEHRFSFVKPIEGTPSATAPPYSYGQGHPEH